MRRLSRVALYTLVFTTVFILVPRDSRAVDDHLLLSEAVVTPTAGEFLEIYNPTGSTVALDNYYLSDDEDYALYPGTFGLGPAPAIGSSDFIAQFPPGSSIGAGAVVVIAFDGEGFLATYGQTADFEIHGTEPNTPDMIASNVGASAGLTNGGESAVLFFWGGQSDKVADIDMLNIGTPTSGNGIANKTGVLVDGPDPDDEPSQYLTDAYTMPLQSGDPGSGTSTKRILLEANGNEVTPGGNGLLGDDETTEDISITWDSTFTAPSPGTISFGGCGGPSMLTCDSDCGSLDAVLGWANNDTYVGIEVFRNGVSVALLPGTDTSYLDGALPAGLYQYEVVTECTNGDLASVSCVLTHCPPPQSTDLLITEIVDGTLVGGRPRWVEITNCGTDPVDLAFYSIGNFNNGGLELGGGVSSPLQGTLAGGDVYVYEYDSAGASRFEEVYGFPADQQAGGGFINGNDVVALFYGLAATDGMGTLDGTVIDIYGQIGVDGEFEDWNYIDSAASRMPDFGQTATFDISQWNILGQGALIGPDDMSELDEIDLLQTLTLPGAHICESTSGPVFDRGDCNADGTFDISDAIFGLGVLFSMGGPPACEDSCDANDDGMFDIADMINVLDNLFSMGPNPPAPFGFCGADPTSDPLGCANYTPCP